MPELTKKQQTFAKLIESNHETYISKQQAVEYVKNIFGSTAPQKDIEIAYDSINWN